MVPTYGVVDGKDAAARSFNSAGPGVSVVRKNRGFSLIEVLMVIAIMLIVLAVALPNVANMNASYRLDGTARGLSSLLQRAHFDAIADTTGYRVLIYPSTAASDSNSYQLQRRTPAAPFDLSAGGSYVDDGDAIAIPSGIDMATSAAEIATDTHAIFFSSSGDVVDASGDYISSDITISLTNTLNSTSTVTISTTSYVSIQ